MSSTAVTSEDPSEPPLASSNTPNLAPPFPSSQQSYLSATTTSSEHSHEFSTEDYSHNSGAPSPGLSSSQLSTPQFSPYSTVSIPPTPAGLDGEDQDPNDRLNPLPQFNEMNLLELSQRDQGTLHHQAHGSGSEARHLSRHVREDESQDRIANEILKRTSAGQELSGDGLSVPGPAPPSSSNSSNAGLSSNVATPGDSRGPTPSNHLAPPSSSATRPQVPTQQSSAHLSVTSAQLKKNASEGGKEKKSVFGKLFDRDKNNSSVSVVSSVAMEHGGGGSTSGLSTTTAGGGGSGDQQHSMEGASLMRRKSGQDKEREKRDKEVKEREKKERKEREKREKEETKEREKREKHDQKERARERSNSRGRSPSQNGRPRGGSHGAGAHEEKSGLGGAMDFMRIKVQRKTSVTSRKSDDGKSDHGDREEGRSQYGGSETKSRGGQSNASLSKKYGVCDKVIVGKGATAVVRLAHKWDRSTERLYAVKEFRKRRKNETEKEYVKKLTSEFCISSTLHHHNVVETVDLVQDEQQHWCEVMEYCPGGDLYAAIKKGDLEPAEINSYFKQIIAGISYLHSMGVAHRDIKPENLLIDAKGHVKITDFGVSDVFRMCWEKKTHLSKGLCGSEPYIAPEQFEQKEYDARLVDVWAAAVVFYCMHFQELPWRVAKPSDPSFGPYLQLYSTSSSTPPPLSNLVPRECRSIIRRMLDPDPKTRATTEVILNDPWFNRIEVIPPLQGILPPEPTLP
ncbi:uncharacterized protein JCM6883_004531 [Sporobolomyces salmoneus]|uniref:uncharacterized protein n=1 Tax=Sporobolomyces salmoneus TaxID=183962 RepID=UPI0031785FEF